MSINTRDLFLSLGSNMGDRVLNLRGALAHITKEISGLITASSLYESQAWGRTEQPSFLNQVVRIESVEMKPIAVLNTVLAIEKKMGRKRIEKWGPRVIDIDVLFFGEEVIETARLNIPHPQMQNRRFVLLPLVEVSAGFQHPIFKKTVIELLQQCTDSLEVHRLA